MYVKGKIEKMAEHVKIASEAALAQIEEFNMRLKRVSKHDMINLWIDDLKEGEKDCSVI